MGHTYGRSCLISPSMWRRPFSPSRPRRVGHDDHQLCLNCMPTTVFNVTPRVVWFAENTSFCELAIFPVGSVAPATRRAGREHGLVFIEQVPGHLPVPSAIIYASGCVLHRDRRRESKNKKIQSFMNTRDKRINTATQHCANASPTQAL